jgi:hypothetical protein
MATSPDMTCNCCQHWHIATQLLVADIDKLKQALVQSERMLSALYQFARDQDAALRQLGATPPPPPNPQETP